MDLVGGIRGHCFDVKMKHHPEILTAMDAVVVGDDPAVTGDSMILLVPAGSRWNPPCTWVSLGRGWRLTKRSVSEFHNVVDIMLRTWERFRSFVRGAIC